MSNRTTITQALPGFIEYAAAERRFQPTTIDGYTESIRFFVKQVGDLTLSEIALQHFITLKVRMKTRNCGESRTAQVINAMKCLLTYARTILQVPIMDLTSIKCPRLPRRRVLYLTQDEIETFVEAIQLRTWTGRPRLLGYSIRALAESLVATGMRISEALALNRDSINFLAKEALIVGKGNKQRTIFFTDRAIGWLKEYLELRNDSNPALFVTNKCTRLSLDVAGQLFRRNTERAGLEKHVTPHILRHTTATLLLQKGCPIGFIKEILGHENLETTCRYYLGILSKAEVKQAHKTFLDQVWKNEPISTGFAEAKERTTERMKAAS